MISKWDARFLALAKFYAGWSSDPSTKVGAVIVRSDRTQVSQGFNGFPRGTSDAPSLYADRETKYARIVHAEANAIVMAREPLHGHTIYVWPFQPCASCSGLIIQSGIKRVVSFASDNPRWRDVFDHGAAMFAEAGVQLDLYPTQEQP